MIYYIYKVRRKQTSIRFSRSALPHRYLRSISWISWNGGHRSQPSTSWAFPPRAAVRGVFSRRCLYPKAAIAVLLLLLPPLTTTLQSFPKKKKNNLLPLFRAPLACRSSCVALPAAIRAHHPDPSAAGPSPAAHVVFCGPPTNKKRGPAALRREPAQKSVDFSLKKNTRRHARLSRSCFGRN